MLERTLASSKKVTWNWVACKQLCTGTPRCPHNHRQHLSKWHRCSLHAVLYRWCKLVSASRSGNFSPLTSNYSFLNHIRDQIMSLNWKLKWPHHYLHYAARNVSNSQNESVFFSAFILQSYNIHHDGIFRLWLQDVIIDGLDQVQILATKSTRMIQ